MIKKLEDKGVSTAIYSLSFDMKAIVILHHALSVLLSEDDKPSKVNDEEFFHCLDILEEFRRKLDNIIINKDSFFIKKKTIN